MAAAGAAASWRPAAINDSVIDYQHRRAEPDLLRSLSRTSTMSDRFLELRRESGHIPSGRQLPRTPPLIEVKRHLDFSSEEPEEACETVGLGDIFLQFNLIYVIIKAKHHL